jgi:hypothetical protein
MAPKQQAPPRRLWPSSLKAQKNANANEASAVRLGAVGTFELTNGYLIEPGREVACATSTWVKLFHKRHRGRDND